MKTKSCLMMILFLIASFAHAQTNNLTALLQQGLFEEQASRNLDAAIADYQQLAAQFDKDRQLAATAVFRLGECYRAQGKTNEAAAQYQRILRDFSDQTTLATLSRQDLAGMGMAKLESVKAEIPVAVENPEMQLYKKLVDRSRDELEKILPTLIPNAALETLIKERSEIKIQQTKLLVDYAPENIQVVRLTKQLEAVDQQIADTISGMMQALKLRAEILPPSNKKQDLVDLNIPVLDDEDREIQRIQQLIQNSPDLINSQDNGGITLLGKAASKGQVRVVNYLLEHGAEINTGFPPLYQAVGAGNRAMVELLLNRGANVNQDCEYGKTALWRAAQEGFQSIVEVLLAHKADVNVNDNRNNMTPVYIAVYGGRDKCLPLLLAAGARVNAETTDGHTALSLAAERGYLNIAKILLAAKADPNAGQRKLPLLSTIIHRDIAFTEMLLQAGANPDAAGGVDGSGARTDANFLNHNGRLTPLWLANWGHDLPMVQLLLKFKADPNNLQTDETSLLFSALSDTNLLESLLAAGAKVDATSPDEMEWTPLGAACNQNLAPAVEILLKHGANPNFHNRNGVTPLHHATYQLVDTKIIELLFAYKVDPNVRTGDGNTPLEYPRQVASEDVSGASASRSQHSKPQIKRAGELADLLRRHGALDELPDYAHIRITRQGLSQPLTVFSRGPLLTNQFTLLETTMRFYALSQVFLSGQSAQKAWTALPFPDFGRLIIRRPAQKIGGKEQEIKVSLLNNSNLVDCAHDVPVEFGDVIEVPESIHALNASMPNPVREVEAALPVPKDLSPLDLSLRRGGGWESTTHAYQTAAQCLPKPVQLVVAGETTTFMVNPWKEGFLKDALAKTEARSVLRSSSDLSRVKVTRKTANAAKPVVFTVNVSNADQLWLQAGDVIEVPENP